MRVVKKINNNVAICVDNNHHELVAFGNGIGFPKTPYELKDLSKIKRTFYGLNAAYFNLLNEIPEDIFEISAKIIDFAKVKIDKEFNPNIVFTLADHIHFAIERYKKNVKIKIPLEYDLQCFYENEMYVAEKAINYINKVKNIHLNKNEAVGIALHFINAENIQKDKQEEYDDDKIIASITEIIETDFNIQINRKGFNYSRFISHLHYLLKRKNEKMSLNSENKKLFESMKEEFKDSYECVSHIAEYFKTTLQWNPSEEELLYLMLHINRLCAREDCYR